MFKGIIRAQDKGELPFTLKADAYPPWARDFVRLLGSCWVEAKDRPELFKLIDSLKNYFDPVAEPVTPATPRPSSSILSDDEIVLVADHTPTPIPFHSFMESLFPSYQPLTSSPVLPAFLDDSTLLWELPRQFTDFANRILEHEKSACRFSTELENSSDNKR